MYRTRYSGGGIEFYNQREIIIKYFFFLEKRVWQMDCLVRMQMCAC
jgi:hypothetical protein